MGTLRTDSPVSLSIVASFLQFLSSVEVAQGTDTEGLEVAAQCLSEVFGVETARAENRIRLLPLVELFKSRLGPDLPTSAGIGLPRADHPSTTTPDGVSSRSHVESSSGRPATEPLKAEATRPSTESLLEQFGDGLELASFFEGTMHGTPEYAERLEQAKQILDASLKKVRASTDATKSKGTPAYSEETLALAEAFKTQGNATMSASQYHDAIQLYTLAISLCSNNAIFYSNRAAALTQVGKYDEAIADCDVAIKYDPRYAKAYSRMGLAYYAQGQLQDAIDKGFKKALELDPSSISVKEGLRAAQQKLEEQQWSRQQHQGPPGASGPQNAGTFRSSSESMNMNFQLPPEINNLMPSLLSLVAQFGSQQAAAANQNGSNSDANPGGASAGGANPNPSSEDERNLEPEVTVEVDGINVTFDGEEGPPNFPDGVSMDPEVTVDGINVTFDGQQVPPQYAGLMQSMFQQMFGGAGQPGWPHGNNQSPSSQQNPNASQNPSTPQNPSTQPGPPGGS